MTTNDKAINVEEVANALLVLPFATDPNDWPYRADILKSGQYSVWVEICHQCSEQAKSLVKKVWFLIEEANARRRLESFAELKQAGDLLSQAKTMVDELDTGDRVLIARLYELIGYHGGWVYGPLGNFEFEANSHNLSLQAVKEGEDERGILFAEYHISYADLKQSIAVNKDIQVKYESFVEVHNKLFAHLIAETEEDKRWRSNLQFHFLFFRWLIKREKPSQKEVKAIEADGREDMYGAIELINALNLSSLDKVIDICRSIDQARADNYWYYLSQIVLANALHRQGNKNDASEICNKIAKIREVTSIHLSQAIIIADLWKQDK